MLVKQLLYVCIRSFSRVTLGDGKFIRCHLAYKINPIKIYLLTLYNDGWCRSDIPFMDYGLCVNKCLPTTVENHDYE